MNRRSALVGSLATLIIPPAMASTLMRELPQAPMTAKERADFHLAEFSRAMDELTPDDAHAWGVYAGGNRGAGWWDRRYVTYRLPDPEVSARLSRPFLIDRNVFDGEGPL